MKLSLVERVVIFGIIAVMVPLFVASASQIPLLTYVKAYPDGTHQITIDGATFWAVDVERARALREAEKTAPIFETALTKTRNDLATTQNDLKMAKDNLTDCRNNLQDERVKYSNLKTDFTDQGNLLTQCVKLSKQGGAVNSLLNKWPVRLTTEVGLPLFQTWKCQR